MSVLTDEKNTLVGILEAVVPTFAYVPSRITPPLAIITNGSPYLQSGDTFGTFAARWDVTLVIPTGANDVTTEALDTLIDDVVVLLVNNKYGVDTVSASYAMEANNATYLAVTVSTTKIINL
jgi:hypothetical protein